MTATTMIGEGVTRNRTLRGRTVEHPQKSMASSSVMQTLRNTWDRNEEQEREAHPLSSLPDEIA